MLVVERVEDHPALAARADEPQVPEQAQLVRHGRLAEPEQRREVADAQLGVRQGVEDAHARRVAEHAERLGQRGHRAAAPSAPARTRATVAAVGDEDLAGRRAAVVLRASYEHLLI